MKHGSAGRGVKAGKKNVKSKAPAVVVEQRKSPYHGEVYGRVFNAVAELGKAEGEQPRQAVVEVVAKKTALAASQVSFALQVFTTPKHQSNMGRSRNAAKQRGHVLLVPVEG